MLTFVAILRFVTVIDNALYSIQWTGDDEHSLDAMASALTDVEYIHSYFEDHATGLEFYKMSKESAILKTAREANEIVNELYEMAQNSLEGIEPDLDEVFRPLHRQEAYRHPRYYTDYKLNGVEAPWVRLYAVRLDENMYVITGFGIKLVKQMHEDDLLVLELNKLKDATEYLKLEGLLD